VAWGGPGQPAEAADQVSGYAEETVSLLLLIAERDGLDAGQARQRLG
jgi:hypothetical protein